MEEKLSHDFARDNAGDSWEKLPDVVKETGDKASFIFGYMQALLETGQIEE